MNRLRILTWHVHGSYLYYLTQARHDFYVPVKAGRPDGYAGRTSSYRWPDNLHEVPAEEVRQLPFDCILFQARANYERDQHEILSAAQRRLPRVYLEHDPPREHPTDTRHPVDDPQVLLVHVTHFNDLMWDAGRTPTRVIDHGVMLPAEARYSGELEKGIVVVNNLPRRGRRLGADIFQRVRDQLPLHLYGMGSDEIGGLGELTHQQLAVVAGRYRFFFNPIRYTSLGLAVCEAMMLGLPMLGLATTEMVTVVKNGVSGYLETDVGRLIGHMRRLLGDPEEARVLGAAARRYALDRFAIGRFAHEWEEAFAYVAGRSGGGRSAVARVLEPVGGSV